MKLFFQVIITKARTSKAQNGDLDSWRDPLEGEGMCHLVLIYAANKSASEDVWMYGKR